MAGVGGQGIILSSDILGEAAIASGYDVKKTDTLGMAQRGGAVVSHIRLARHVWSPLIRQGEVDILLAFEKLEAASWGHCLRAGGIAIVNNHSLPPLSVFLGHEKYPDDREIMVILQKRTNRIYFINGTACARELGDARVLSLFMLGCASFFMPLKVGIWKEAISERLPEKIRPLNLKAFEMGRREVGSQQLAISSRQLAVSSRRSVVSYSKP